MSKNINQIENSSLLVFYLCGDFLWVFNLLFILVTFCSEKKTEIKANRRTGFKLTALFLL